MSATDLFTCGAECGVVAGVSGVGRHLNAQTGSPTIETTIVEPGGGTKAFRFTATGTAVNHRLDLTSTNFLTGRIYFYVATAFPVANCTIFRAQNAAGDSFDIRVGTTGNVIAQLNTTNVVVGTYTADTWHYVDFTFDDSSTVASAASITAKLDGGTQQVVNATATGTGLTFARFGVITATTCDVIIDHVRLTSATADYPIGPGYVQGYLPTSTGTHNQTTGDLQDQTPANIANGDGSWANLDEVLGNGTDWVQQSVARTTSYAEYLYGTASETNTPRVVEQVVTTTAAGTGNTQKAQLYDGTTAADAYALAATAAAIQTWTKNWTVDPTGSAWSNAQFKLLRLRWGFSNDVIPVPAITNSLLEAEFAPAAGGGGAGLLVYQTGGL